MRILVKYPTRERYRQFETILNRTYEMATDKENVHFLVSVDANDPQVRMYQAFAQGKPYVTMVTGISNGKIHACNRDVNEYAGHWDVLLLLSDDMIPSYGGWDVLLRQEMDQHHPDLDGVLFHSDGYQRDRLNTMCIMGRKYYDRFRYVYNPEYTSLWCDNEFMLVSRQLKKEFYSDVVLFRHEHYGNNRHIRADSLMVKNEKFYQQDKGVFERRRARNFDIQA
jgi:hypothetical protein